MTDLKKSFLQINPDSKPSTLGLELLTSASEEADSNTD